METPTEPINGVESAAVAVAEVNAADLVAPLGERMPPVTETTGDSTPPPEPSKAFPVDGKGRRFDPETHAANDDGTPKLDKNGLFYPKNIGRKKGDKSVANNFKPVGERPPPSFADGTGGPLADPNAPKGSGADEYDLMAEVYLQSAYGPLMIAFSEAMRPNGEQHAALKQSLAAWLRFKQAKELSPGWGFSVTAAAVFVAKTNEPEVKERMTLWASKVRGWFKRDK